MTLSWMMAQGWANFISEWGFMDSVKINWKEVHKIIEEMKKALKVA